MQSEQKNKSRNRAMNSNRFDLNVITSQRLTQYRFFSNQLNIRPIAFFHSNGIYLILMPPPFAYHSSIKYYCRYANFILFLIFFSPYAMASHNQLPHLHHHSPPSLHTHDSSGARYLWDPSAVAASNFHHPSAHG